MTGKRLLKVDVIEYHLSMIRNLVFDMGNVLVRWTPDSLMDWMGINDCESREELKKKMFQSPEWSLLDWGVLDEDGAERIFCSRIGENLHPYINHALHWFDMIHPVEGMAAYIEKKKNEGYGIYLLSNASASTKDYFHLIPGSQFFDGVVFSGDVGLIKPMPEIYDLLLKRYSLRGEECLFIDDLPVNVAGALHEGMNGVVFRKNIGEIEEYLNYLNH